MFAFLQQSLTEGTLLLGCVKKSNQFDLVISLPNGLTGFVKITCICDAYNELLNKQVATDEPLEVRHNVELVDEIHEDQQRRHSYLPCSLFCS